MIAETAQSAPKVAFLHIMKTGGMTFRRILSSVYGEAFHVCDDPEISAIEAAIARFQCIEFHIMPRGSDWVHLHGELARQSRWDVLAGMQVFTMLRDPVDQFISQYYYLVSIRASVEPMLKAQGLPFPESLEWLLDHPASFNDQLAFLAGKSQRTGICVNADDLAGVKKMLMDLSVHVGLTERFADSLHVFETVTGRKIPQQVVHDENRNSARPALEAVSAAVKDRIREQSALEVELYEFGRELFLQDLARCGPAPAYSFVAGTSEGAAGAAQPPAVAVVSEQIVPERAPAVRRSFVSRLFGIFGRD